MFLCIVYNTSLLSLYIVLIHQFSYSKVLYLSCFLQLDANPNVWPLVCSASLAGVAIAELLAKLQHWTMSEWIFWWDLFLSCVVLAQKICILNCLLKLDAHCPSQMFDLDCSVSLAGVAIVVELLAEPQHCTMLPQGGCFDEISFFQLKTCEKSLRRGLISPRSSPHSRHQRLKGQENEFLPTTTTNTALNLLPHLTSPQQYTKIRNDCFVFVMMMSMITALTLMLLMAPRASWAKFGEGWSAL